MILVRSALNQTRVSRALQLEVIDKPCRGQPYSIILQWLDFTTVTSHRLYLQCKIWTEIFSTAQRTSQYVVPHWRRSWNGVRGRQRHKNGATDTIYVGSKKVWYLHSPSLPPLITTTLFFSTFNFLSYIWGVNTPCSILLLFVKTRDIFSALGQLDFFNLSLNRSAVWFI